MEKNKPKSSSSSTLSTSSTTTSNIPSSPTFDSYIQSIRVIYPEGRSPFASQLQVLNKTLQAYKDGCDVLVESPTGTGKVG